MSDRPQQEQLLFLLLTNHTEIKIVTGKDGKGLLTPYSIRNVWAKILKYCSF